VGRDPWRKKNYLLPRGGDGYHDGENLYEAYYVPNEVDPNGLFTQKLPLACGTLEIEIRPNGNSASVTITAKSNGSCCTECKHILGAQWINDGGHWRSDVTEGTHGSWYNYNPSTGTFNAQS
jgi:hypothetical protein